MINLEAIAAHIMTFLHSDAVRALVVILLKQLEDQIAPKGPSA